MPRKKQDLVLPDLEQIGSKKNSTKKPIKGIPSKAKPIIRRAPDLEMDPPTVRKKVVPGMNRVFGNGYTHGLEGEEQSMSSMADLTFGERVEIQRAKMVGMLWVNRKKGEAGATTEEAGAAIVEKEGVTVSEAPVMARKRGRPPKKGPEAKDMAVTSEKAATSGEAADALDNAGAMGKQRLQQRSVLWMMQAWQRRE